MKSPGVRKAPVHYYTGRASIVTLIMILEDIVGLIIYANLFPCL